MVLADVVDLVQELPILIVVCLVVAMVKGTEKGTNRRDLLSFCVIQPSFNAFYGGIDTYFSIKYYFSPIYQCFTAGKLAIINRQSQNMDISEVYKRNEGF